MKKLALTLTLAALVVQTYFVNPGAARATSTGDLDHIDVTYFGGPLLQHVRVSLLLMGQGWQNDPFPNYLKSFFVALFADGRYMANLAQYSTGDYQIGNGALVAAAWDYTPLPASVTDAQIQDDIRAGIKAGVLPPVETDSLYVVFTAYGTVVVDGHEDSVNNFYGYHGYASDGQGGGFAYAVIAYPAQAWRLTKTASHELAEAVTDPQPDKWSTTGWYDKKNGEIGDIPVALYNAGRVPETGYLDILTATDGTEYIVQKEWSNQDGMPVAFAHVAGP